LTTSGLRLVWTVAVAVLLRLWSRDGLAQTPLEILPVQGHVYMLAGAGGNITLHVGEQGILAVDAGRADASAAILAAIHSLSDRQIHYIINTSADDDHTGGNATLSQAGSTAPGVSQGANGPGALVIAHENVLNRMDAPNGARAPAPPASWPTVTFFTPKKTMSFNDDPIEMLWQKAAHTDGDLFVFFRASDVVSVGDVLSTTTYPVVDVGRGGSIQGEIDALNRIIDITIPRFNQMGGTRVIPGHGRICDEADVVEYRDMVTIVRDRVRALVDKGMSLEQVQTARPTYEYDPLYGAESGSWTTRMFVEAVYKGVMSQRTTATAPSTTKAGSTKSKGK
jgi:glyoxylase-like metal-dependent hydrolase (beta-lactamase superfamily II)